MSQGGTEVEPPGRGLIERLLPPVDLLGEDGLAKPTRMTPREQLVAGGLGLANVALAAAAASTMQREQAFALIAGLVASAVTVAGARIGNRLVGIVGLFATTLVRPSSASIFLAVVLPYYVAAMWMFLKYNRLVKAQGAARRQQRSDGTGGATPRTNRSSDKRSNGKVAAKARPTASKRYTPPKHKKRPPPPTKPPRDRSPVD